MRRLGGHSPGSQQGQAGGQVPLSGTGGAITVGDNHGIISTGPNSTNIMLQLRVQGEAAQYRAVAELTTRDVPVLGTFREREPVGRAEVIARVAAEIADGMSVQLHGAPGVGKKAVARAVIRQLATSPAPPRGIEVPSPGGQPHTLDSVYEFLTGAFFTEVTFSPPSGSCDQRSRRRGWRRWSSSMTASCPPGS